MPKSRNRYYLLHYDYNKTYIMHIVLFFQNKIKIDFIKTHLFITQQ